jgi:hypothetical protein
MLFAPLDHHIPRSASSIESSGASEDEALSITKHPARELALMNAVGLLPPNDASARRDAPTLHRFAALGCPA